MNRGGMDVAVDASHDVEQADLRRRPFPKGSVVLRDRRQLLYPAAVAVAVAEAVQDVGGRR